MPPYADRTDRKAWRVVQILGFWTCDAKGVVLLLHRKTSAWKAIYDVPSGCFKKLNFPFRGMVVQDGRLFVSACTSCGGWGLYDEFVVDLRTLRVARPQQDPKALGARRENDPPIRALEREVFGG